MALLLISCIIIARRDLRRRQFSLYWWLTVTLTLAMISTSIIGAQDEWQRLILPAYPCLLLLLAETFITAAHAAGYANPHRDHLT